MIRTGEELPIVHLKAGEMHYADRPTLVVTVVGSCLSVVLYSRRLGIGGICHRMLPSCGNQKTCRRGCAEKFRYVDCAIRQMVKIFDRSGVKRSKIETKCFGGADMFSRPIEKPGFLSVGRQNAETAEEVMKSEGLTLITRDVGGLQGRQILFYTQPVMCS